MRPLSLAHKPRQAAFTKIGLWLASELLLGSLGLDDMADMGEWVFERRGGCRGVRVEFVQ